MKIRALLVPASIMSLLLVACVQQQVPKPLARYSKAGATQEAFMKDRYECLQQSEQRVSGAFVSAYGGASNSQMLPSCGVWFACLGARGYTVDPNGNLSAPPGMIVYCR
jgi:hypothetical protein